MGSFLEDFRANNPDNQLSDVDLVEDLRRQYNDDSGENLTLDDFQAVITYQPVSADIKQPQQKGIFQEFRERHPQLNDMSDDKLLNELYEQNDDHSIGFDEFKSVVGFPEPEYDGPVAEAYEPTFWESVKSWGTSDAKRARAANELAARQVAKEQGKSTEQVYQEAGFQRPMINPEGRPGVQAFAEGAEVVAEELPNIPQGTLNSILRVVRGGDETAENNFLDDAIEYTEPAKPEFTDPNYQNFYGVGKSLGTSLAVLSATALATAAASGTGPGAPVVGGATGAGTAFRASKDEFLGRIKTILDTKSKKINGRPLNQDEWSKAYSEYEAAANKYGAWEAIPEALSNVVFMRALAAPMKGLGKKALNEVSKRAAKVMASEQVTETITGVGQSGAEEEAGIGKQKTAGEAFKEQAIQTALVTSILGGGAAGGKFGLESAEERFSPERTIGREMLAQSKRAETPAASMPEQVAIDSLDPDQATMEAIHPEIARIKDLPREQKTIAEMVKEKVYDKGVEASFVQQEELQAPPLEVLPTQEQSIVEPEKVRSRVLVKPVEPAPGMVPSSMKVPKIPASTIAEYVAKKDTLPAIVKRFKKGSLPRDGAILQISALMGTEKDFRDYTTDEVGVAVGDYLDNYGIKLATPKITQAKTEKKQPIDSLEMPKRISNGPVSFKTSPIGGKLYRETSIEGMASLIRESLSNNHEKGAVTSLFVTDNQDIAIGQGKNQGVSVVLNGDLVSGKENFKPGTGIAGSGREFKTDYINRNAIESFVIPKGTRLAGLPQSFARREFDIKKNKDGTTTYTRKQKEPKADKGISFSKQPTDKKIKASEFSSNIKRKHPNIKFGFSGVGDVITLDKIIVPEEMRSAGTGTKAMNDVLALADQNGKTIALSPTSDFGGTKARLNKFYKKFGFVENKGKNKDYEISESMYRLPQSAPKADLPKRAKTLPKKPKTEKKSPKVAQKPPKVSKSRSEVAPKPEMEAKQATKRPQKVDDNIHKAGGKDKPMPNFQPMFRKIGFPERPTSGKIQLGENAATLPPEDKPVRREGIQTRVEDIIGPRIYNKKIKGKSTLGYYRRDNSEVRLTDFYDIEVLAHEMAHYLDFHYKYKGRFTESYNNPTFKSEVEALSYTSDPEKIGSEGFAEFVRLWLTQYDVAQKMAPKFTKRFKNELAKDSGMSGKMHVLQAKMHQWFNQGDMARLNAVMTGNQYTAKERFTRMTNRRPIELTRQRWIDHIHGAKVITRETQGKLGEAGSDPYKQLQLLNGISGLFEESVKRGAPVIKNDGDITFMGPSLKDIWGKSIKTSVKRLRQQEMYFVARRAEELKKQKRENLITYEMINAGLSLAEKYPYFETAFSDYQEYTKNMMEFYVESGYLERKSADAMMKKNKNYVPFHRVKEGVIEAGKSGSGGGFMRLKGGGQNIQNVYDNIIKRDSQHIQSALKAKALRDLYSSTLQSQEGGKYLSRIPPDSELIKVNFEDMLKKANDMLDEMGVEITAPDGAAIENEAQVREYFENNPEELIFWNHGLQPKTIETMIDSYIDEQSGKRVWVEFNKDNALLADMINSLDGFTLPQGIAGSALGFAMKVKQFQTLSITSMMQFAGPNIIRDQQQAFFLSGGKFRPVYDPLIGLGRYLEGFVKKNSMVSEMKAQGGPGGGRVRTFLENEWGFVDRKDYKLEKPFYHPTQLAKNLLDLYVNIMDSAEMATRIGFYSRLRKEGVSAREAAFQAREISTDFHKHGSYAAFVLLQRTVPFFGAYVQSVDRDLRGMADKNGEIKFSNLIKTESGRASLSDLKVKMMGIGALYVSIHITLALLGGDDEKYKALTPDQKARFFNFFIDGQHYTLPKPHGLITLLGSFAEGLTDSAMGEKDKHIAKDILFATAYHLGADAMPGIINPIAEIALNKTFTGAPIIGQAEKSRDAIYQYSNRTPLLYVKAGEHLGVSPNKLRHAVRGYTGYIEEVIAEATEEYLWDYAAWGERSNKRTAGDMIGKQFNPKKVPYRTKYTMGYYDLKKRALTVKANLSFAKKSLIKDKSLVPEVIENKVNQSLLGLNKLFGKVDKVLSNQQVILDSYSYNKELTAKEKTEGIEGWYRQKNEILKQSYEQASRVLEQAEKDVKEAEKAAKEKAKKINSRKK